MTLPPLNVTLNGAGSTFVLPLLSAIDSSYTRVNPSVRINYQAVGSATGITLLATKSVDFAASDAPLSNVQIVSVPNVLTIPETVGAVVIAYNIPINSTYSMQVYTSM
jgi:ABC-type phosphate transport system substrate-binding protein